MNLGHILFSFSGRINRAKYWLGLVIAGVLATIVLIVGAFADPGIRAGGEPGRTYFIAIAIFLAWPETITWLPEQMLGK